VRARLLVPKRPDDPGAAPGIRRGSNNGAVLLHRVPALRQPSATTVAVGSGTLPKVRAADESTVADFVELEVRTMQSPFGSSARVLQTPSPAKKKLTRKKRRKDCA
jgi:hypothetical protein